jgi:hypothetical protein
VCGTFIRNALFSSLSFAFYLSFFIFSFKIAQGEVEGHCPGVVTSGGNVTHKCLMEMRRLACDETPVHSAMQLRVTAVVW